MPGMEKGAKIMEHSKQAVTVITKKNLSFWDKQREAFFAKDPHCKICNEPLHHYSRTMECGNCQNKKYRKRK